MGSPCQEQSPAHWGSTRSKARKTVTGGRLKMKNTPLLQLALDYISLPPALVMAAQVGPEVDIIEIGTPLCKAAGIDAVRAVREICPNNLILADLKTPDVGGLEAAMAFDAGADMMTVIG